MPLDYSTHWREYPLFPRIVIWKIDEISLDLAEREEETVEGGRMENTIAWNGMVVRLPTIPDQPPV